MEGSKVGGSSLKFVKFSSASDTGEDKEAMFTDGTKRITTLSSNVVYVTSVFEKGSYAPLIITGTTKDSSESPDNNTDPDTEHISPKRSSGSGCNSSLVGLGGLILVMFQLRKKSVK